MPSSLITFQAPITIATRKRFLLSSELATGSTVYRGISMGEKGILQNDEKQFPGKGTKRWYHSPNPAARSLHLQEQREGKQRHLRHPLQRTPIL